MDIALLNIEKLIKVNDLKEITSPKLFLNTINDPNGLLSNEIFGISKFDRRNTFAYINLEKHFIHPHIYANVLKKVYRKIAYLISGQKKFKVVDNQLVEDPAGWTGIEQLYRHWDQIHWSKLKSSREIEKNILTKTPRDLIFVKDWPVCPPAYRDVMHAGTKDSSDYINELNDMYVKLIRSVALLESGGLFASRQYLTEYKIEELLVDIYNYFRQQLEKKNGLIKRNLLGKSVDYGARTVISAPNYSNDKFEDNMVDYDHAEVPISQVCSIFYPFVEAYVKNFFTREIINDPNYFTFHDPKTGKSITASMEDAELQFSDKNIRKLINNYINNPDDRFTPIEINVLEPTKNGGTKKGKANLLLIAQVVDKDGTKKPMRRLMTMTDLLYMAAYDVTKNRHVFITRYPIGTDKGLIFQKINVRSTNEHCTIIYHDQEYKNYPVIDFSTPHDKVGTKFLDSLTFSNEHLLGLGGDYTWSNVMVPYDSNIIQEKAGERLTSGVTNYICC